MKLFLTPTSAKRHASDIISNRPGWSFKVVSRRIKNRDGSVDIGFGAVLFGEDRLHRGAL